MWNKRWTNSPFAWSAFSTYPNVVHNTRRVADGTCRITRKTHVKLGPLRLGEGIESWKLATRSTSPSHTPRHGAHSGEKMSEVNQHFRVNKTRLHVASAVYFVVLCCAVQCASPCTVLCSVSCCVVLCGVVCHVSCVMCDVSCVVYQCSVCGVVWCVSCRVVRV